MEKDFKGLREKLAREIGPADWKTIGPHCRRGAVFVVAADLDLAEAASRVAGDDATRVKEWIESGKLARPSEKTVLSWEASGRELLSVVVAPYVIVQEMQDT